MSASSAADSPSVTDFLRAARAVAAAPNGKEAMETVRPRGVTGVFRDRAPLAILLYIAHAEDRLVWQGVGGFALLEPPLVGPRVWQPRGFKHTVLSWLDRRWGAVGFVFPALVAILFALVMLPFPALRWPAVGLILAAMVYTTGVMIVMAVWQVFFGRVRDAEVLALESVSGRHWSMPLFHQENERRVDELFDQVRTRLHRLVADQASHYGADIGGQVDSVRLAETLICLHSGVTSPQARARVEAERARVLLPSGTGSSFSLQMFDGRAEDLARRPAKPPAFFRFYLASVIVLILGLAFIVMTVERGECAVSGCDDRAITTYGRALTWLSYQLVWREAPGLEPVSGFAVVLSVMLTVLLPVVVLVAVVAHRSRSKAAKQVQDNIKQRQIAIMGTTRVLIVTVADVERDAMLDVIEEYANRTVEPRFDRSVPVFAAGAVNDTELFVVQAGAQGINNPAGATVVAAHAIRHVAPHYAVIVGICYGLRPDEQRVGDVLVSERIRDLDHAKLVEVDGILEQQDRGENVTPSPMLLNACRAAQRGWLRKSGVDVRFGQMLAWNKLLNASLVVDDLRARYPEAIGGDMEGAGFHASTRGARVDSILIKSICDWGMGKTDEHQRTAARNAAEFVFHLVLTGALAHDPASRLANRPGSRATPGW